MNNISVTWYRFLQIVVLTAVILTAFGTGVVWQTYRVRTLPGADKEGANGSTNNSSKVSILRTSIRAEFNPQSALLLGANELVRYQQAVFIDVVRATYDRIPIIGFVNDDNEAELGQELLSKADLPFTSVRFIKHPLNSMWLRDFGPLFARWSDGTVRIVHATYDKTDENGPRDLDDKFSMYVAKIMRLELDRMPLVLEGGNLLSNGDGLMVSTTKVVDVPQNRRYTVEQIGSMLKTYLGCRAWICPQSMEGEPTAHIDFCMTFLRRNVAVVGQYDADYDPENAAILDEIARVLEGQMTSMGPMVVERIPMPPRTKEGDWRSYCNVLIINGIILMPSYSEVDPDVEAKAKATYARLMPSWKVVTIPSDTLVKKRGVLHCIGITVPGYVDIQPLLRETM